MQRRRLHKIVAAAVGAVLAVASLTACSTDAGAGGGSIAAPEGDPIKIGMICSCTGAQAASLGANADVAKAWESWVNDNGGINGHPVQVIQRDDGLDPARSLQAVRELVENEGVQAIVANGSPVDTAWQEYVEDEGIPVIGGMTQGIPAMSSPVFFSTGPSIAAEFFAVAQLVSKAGLTSQTMTYCAESPLCAAVTPMGQAFADYFGIEFRSTSVDASSPNYTAMCLAQKNEGAESITLATDALVGLRIAQDCGKQGFEPFFANTLASASDKWAVDPAFNGSVLTSATALFTDESVPGVKEFLDALKKYQPQVLETESFNANALWAWAGFKLYEVAAVAGDLGPDSTPADVMAGLYALDGETLNGITAPLSYTEGQPTFIPCYFTVGIEEGGYVSLNDGEPTCLEQKDIEGFQGALASMG